MNPQDIGILIVDDEFWVRDCLASWFQADGYRVDTAADANEAMQKLQNERWHIVLLDIKMPGMDGIELQRHIRKIDPNLITIIITAFASVDTAIQALKDGAFDYICKPIDPDELSHLVRNGIERLRLLSENQALKERVNELFSTDEIVGDTPAMKGVIQMIQEVANTDATVMIRGESGTGKELVARAIHKNSNRRYFPLISINCGAYPEGLLESELFGHEKGAFTGAQFARKGKLEMADKGTIFLDEIGDITPKMQMDLLRVIETKRFYRLGGSKEIGTDFRIISATNRNLEEMVKEGKFREDLYYRLNVVEVTLPPLRERPEDIPLLVHHFLSRYGQQSGRRFTSVEPEAMEACVAHRWTGNVRELQHVIERAVLLGREPVLRRADLPESIGASKGGLEVAGAELYSLPYVAAKAAALKAFERRYLTHALTRANGSISEAARTIGLDRSNLRRLMKQYGVEKLAAQGGGKAGAAAPQDGDGSDGEGSGESALPEPDPAA